MVVRSIDNKGNPVAKEVYTSAQYETLTKILITQIKDAGYTSIVAVARGGLPILAMIEKFGKGILPSNIRFGVLHATSYVAEGNQKDVQIADCISFLNGGGVGNNPLMLDDMFDSGKSKIAIDEWAKKNGISTLKWGVNIQKGHSTQNADHVAQRVSNRWVIQPQEYWDPRDAGANIAKILSSPEHILGPDGNFDNLQKLAEMISRQIALKNASPTSIIGSGDIRTAHTAAMVSRILCLPSGTHLEGGRLSFVNPASKTNDLGGNPFRIMLPYGKTDAWIGTELKTEADLGQFFSRYRV